MQEVNTTENGIECEKMQKGERRKPLLFPTDENETALRQSRFLLSVQFLSQYAEHAEHEGADGQHGEAVDGLVAEQLESLADAHVDAA